ncbi:TPA: hypothetical protein VDA67_004906 [Burkholderia vietnamiensis]|nr:hypothetical protein [Burkholderia vietnamiensis]HEP6286455.1 hypothetical protein [Burkholderia vietnamiensis]
MELKAMLDRVADLHEPRVHEVVGNAHRKGKEFAMRAVERRPRYVGNPALRIRLYRRRSGGFNEQLLVLGRFLECVRELAKILAPFQPPINHLHRFRIPVQEGFVAPDYILARQHVSTLGIRLWGWIIARLAGVMRRR